MTAKEKSTKAVSEKMPTAKVETSKLETWLYHKEKGGKIHRLAPGAAHPKGWRDTPWPQEETEEGKNPKEKGRP